jgi:multiple sugar transport system permease protein
MAQSDIALLSAPRTESRATLRRRFFSADNPWLWLSPALLFLLFYSIFPLVYNLILSFNEFNARKKVFVSVGLDNWLSLLRNADGRVYNSLGVTIQYTIIALVIELLLGLVIALLLDARPWGVGIMQTLIILPMVTAPAVAGMLFRLLEHSEFGVISWVLYGLGIMSNAEPLIGGTGKYALYGVAVVDVWQWTPFFALILLAGLKSIPHELLEASEVDGADWWHRLLRVKLPLLRGVLTVAILFRLVDLYKVFDYIAIMTAGGPALHTETLSFYGYVYTFQQVKWGYGAAIGLSIMLFGWISSYAYQRILRVRW